MYRIITKKWRVESEYSAFLLMMIISFYFSFSYTFLTLWCSQIVYVHCKLYICVFFLLTLWKNKIRTLKSRKRDERKNKRKWASRFDERIKRQMYQMGCGDTKRGELLAYTWLICRREWNWHNIPPHTVSGYKAKNSLLQNLRFSLVCSIFSEN